MNALYEKCIEIIDVELFRRLIGIVEERYPGERPDPIAAHAKLCCTSEGPNEKSLANSTEAERAIGKALADEIMAIDVPGLYGVDAMRFIEIVTALPEEPESIRRLALCFDQYAAILILSLSYDISDQTRPPVINTEYILTKAVPLSKQQGATIRTLRSFKRP
jgi:hypothetical protein